ncbi:MAG: DUF3352 domain-containing protein [Chloroflexota bacterium]|nr:MAG: DUF3352 domain-containing protein [Chloroflexota bacterium]
MNEHPVEEKRSISRSGAVLSGIIVAAVAIAGCLVLLVGGLIVIDPLGWNLLDQLFGGADDAAAAMPPDTSLFVGLDLLELTPEKIGRIVDPFLAAAEEPDVPDFDAGLDSLDIEMLEEYGFTISDDILPWLGRYGGFGVTDLEMDEFGSLEGLKWSLVIATRNEKAADAFSVKLRDAIEEETGYDFDTTAYNDVTVYELDVPENTDGIAMARHDELVVFGANTDTIKASIAAKEGDSLADGEDYKVLADQLPDDRAITVFAAKSLYETLQEGYILGLSPSEFAGLGTGSAASSLRITKDGLQFDTANIVERPDIEVEGQSMLDAVAVETVTDEMFPDSTVVYLAGQRPDLQWLTIRNAISDSLGQGDLDESMEMFADEFGINPDTHLFPLLDGEWAIGVVPGAQGLLSRELDIDLNLVLLAQTSEPEALSANLRLLSDYLEQQLVFVELAADGEFETFTLREDPQGQPLLSFGIGNNYLFVSTDAGATAAVFSDGPSLADSKRYQETWDAFPRKMTPVYYVNASGLIGAVREGMDPSEYADFDEVARYFEPITAIAGATEWHGDVTHSSMIVFVSGGE